MNRRAVALVLATLFFPALLSANASYGSEPQYLNYIRADGSVEGTGSIQRAGDVYTFLGDVSGSLCVERDNIAIDCAGFVLDASNDTRISAISLAQRRNVTVENVSVVLNGFLGIDLANSSECKIMESRFSGVPSASPSAENPVAASARGIAF